jgi:SAM-dependent methyltransferase
MPLDSSVALGSIAPFIVCDLNDTPNHIDEKFDIVYTGYGTIGWLPDINRWAEVIHHFLKPGGKLVFVEFHPVVWMFDDDFTKVKYPCHNAENVCFRIIVTTFYSHCFFNYS